MSVRFQRAARSHSKRHEKLTVIFEEDDGQNHQEEFSGFLTEGDRSEFAYSEPDLLTESLTGSEDGMFEDDAALIIAEDSLETDAEIKLHILGVTSYYSQFLGRTWGFDRVWTCTLLHLDDRNAQSGWLRPISVRPFQAFQPVGYHLAASK